MSSRVERGDLLCDRIVQLCLQRRPELELCRDILADSGGDPEARSERDEAASWLREYLIQQSGSAKASDILQAARVDGIAEATLKRARKRAGIATTRQGFGQGSV